MPSGRGLISVLVALIARLAARHRLGSTLVM